MPDNQINGSPENIVNNYGGMVSSICHRMMRNSEDVKDAMQEAWAEILEGLADFRGEAKLSTWIYTVTYRVALRYLRKEKLYSIRYMKDYFHQDPLEIPVDIDYDKQIWIKEMCDKCLTGMLHCLDGESRIAYLFRDLVQLSYEDIADIVGKDPATVRKIVSRCRKKLRCFLNDECILLNPNGQCRCRMKKLVSEIQLPEEYMKLRQFTKRANIYAESLQILPQINYWEKYLYLCHKTVNNSTYIDERPKGLMIDIRGG